tara:strand:+ start:2084 stop:2335 length:252 start_codon:yes stop_codon:yes gene_type:complete
MSINNVLEFGISAQGRKELTNHRLGKRLTQKQAILAKCYDCMGGYDKKMDCEIPKCSLHPFMPYNPDKRLAVASPAKKKGIGT